jgi:hypothetical protein
VTDPRARERHVGFTLDTSCDGLDRGLVRECPVGNRRRIEDRTVHSLGSACSVNGLFDTEIVRR